MSDYSSTYGARFWENLNKPEHRRLMTAMAYSIDKELKGKTNSVLDVGAGLGMMAEWFAKPDGWHHVIAIEAPGAEEYVRSMSPSAYHDEHIAWDWFDLTSDPEDWPRWRSFDLAVCIEVAEHLPGLISRALVKMLTEAAPVVWFSAAYPGQGGDGHINERPAGFWEALFGELGFRPDEEATERIRRDYEPSIGTEWWYRRATLYRRT